jgi:hypothetical protein
MTPCRLCFARSLASGVVVVVVVRSMRGLNRGAGVEGMVCKTI